MQVTSSIALAPRAIMNAATVLFCSTPAAAAAGGSGATEPRTQPNALSLLGFVWPVKPPIRKQLTVLLVQFSATQPPWPSSKTSHLVLALQREQHSATFAAAVASIRKRVSVLSFPYVCPEPVLAKRSFIV